MVSNFEQLAARYEGVTIPLHGANSTQAEPDTTEKELSDGYHVRSHNPLTRGELNSRPKLPPSVKFPNTSLRSQSPYTGRTQLKMAKKYDTLERRILESQSPYTGRTQLKMAAVVIGALVVYEKSQSPYTGRTQLKYIVAGGDGCRRG